MTGIFRLSRKDNTVTRRFLKKNKSHKSQKRLNNYLSVIYANDRVFPPKHCAEMYPDGACDQATVLFVLRGDYASLGSLLSPFLSQPPVILSSLILFCRFIPGQCDSRICVNIPTIMN